MPFPPARRLPVLAAGGVLGLLLQGCLRKPKACSEEGFDCTHTGCCVTPGLKCYARDSRWATCKASCTAGYASSCELIHPNGTRTKPHPTPAPTPAPTSPPAPVPPMPRSGVQWETGTWTTGYWDCCKPSCSWEGKGNTDNPVTSCAAGTGKKLADSNVKSVCNGGTAVTCSDNRPFEVHANLSMGFVAAAVSGSRGLVGDENCGQCYELLFGGRQHVDEGTGDLWGGADPDLVGKRMIVQVTNIGHDVTGNHSFDIQIPGAGQGIFHKGCKTQFPGYAADDFDCGVRYGGCKKKADCAKLPKELRGGCEWRFGWYEWLHRGGQTNNPYIRFRRVQCPQRLVDISGSRPTDDKGFPAAVESESFYYFA